MPARVRIGGVIARVVRVAVATVAIVGRGRIADEVVARQHVRVEVAVVGNAGVDHRHHHAAAIADIPGQVGADAGVGIVYAPLIRIIGVIGRQYRVQHPIEFHVLDTRVVRELPDQHRRFATIQPFCGDHHIGAHRHAPNMPQPPGRRCRRQRAVTHRFGQLIAGTCNRRIQRTLPGWRIGGFRAAGTVFHDESGELLAGLKASHGITHRCHPGGTGLGGRDDHRQHDKRSGQTSHAAVKSRQQSW